VIAYISGQAGIAALVEGSRCSFISVDAPAVTLTESSALHQALTNSPDLIVVEDTTIEVVREHLNFVWQRDRCLHLILMLLDSKTPTTEQQTIGRLLPGLFGITSVAHFVRNRLYCDTLPKKADLKRATESLEELGDAKEVVDFLKKLADDQESIAVARSAWEKVYAETPDARRIKDELFLILVNGGTFYEVSTGGDSWVEPFTVSRLWNDRFRRGAAEKLLRAWRTELGLHNLTLAVPVDEIHEDEEVREYEKTYSLPNVELSFPEGTGQFSETEVSRQKRTDYREENELVAAARGGDIRAFGRLFDQYRSVCLRRATLLIPNRADAEDEVQNAFWKAFQRLDQFRGEGTFVSWLARIVENQCLQRKRSEQRSPLVNPDKRVELDSGISTANQVEAELKWAGTSLAATPGFQNLPGHILIVDNEDGARSDARAQLERAGYHTATTSEVSGALRILGKGTWDCMIASLDVPDCMELVKRSRMDYPDMAVIVITAYGTVQTAVEAMSAGAYDYITKPVHPYELKAIVKRSLEHNRLRQEARLWQSAQDKKSGFEDIIGSSPRLLEALDRVARLAATDATVLISGETGTGKELVAKAIHLRSNRRSNPFMAINCGAIPRELLESELFGHVTGLFTGAATNKKGKIEMADGGTLLLDEIGEMPLELQVRILRLIQEHEIEKIGATVPTKVDVRIIAATHRDLATMVEQGRFREDLYYRLLVVPIKLPALRERPGDIQKLLQHFFVKFREKHGRADLTMKPEVLQACLEYAWPGNIRELENAVERMVLLANLSEITAADLPDFLRSGSQEQEPIFSLSQHRISLETVEKEMILQALKQCGGNQTQAARYLVLLCYKIKQIQEITRASAILKVR
jgi:two-component system NtrC family response regulator